MSIHINGDHNSVNIYGDVNFGEDYELPPPPIGFFGIFFLGMVLVWLIVKFWWVVLIAAAVWALGLTIRQKQKERRQAALEAQRREKMLAERAERQNSAYLRGEPWGLYGSFPPPPEV